MPKSLPPRALCAAFVVILLVIAPPQSVNANHSWNGFHWFRNSSPKLVPLHRFLSGVWLARFGIAVSDWNNQAPSRIKWSPITTGSQNPACPTVNGAVSACDGAYGRNGWLGIATVWVSGIHIVRGTTRMNDTYFNQSPYNTTPWRQLVMCQELAHTWGLAHQDVNFFNQNLGTCMDYTNNPLGPPSNLHPNAHDRQELLLIYAHLDQTIPSAAGQSLAAAQMPQAMDEYQPLTTSQLGRFVWSGNDGRTQLYELDFGQGFKVANWVIWAETP